MRQLVTANGWFVSKTGTTLDGPCVISVFKVKYHPDKIYTTEHTEEIPAPCDGMAFESHEAANEYLLANGYLKEYVREAIHG